MSTAEAIKEVYESRDNVRKCIVVLRNYVWNHRIERGGCSIWTADDEGNPVLRFWDKIADHPKCKLKNSLRD